MNSSSNVGVVWMGLRIAAVPAMCVTLAACGSTASVKTASKPRPKEYFAESIYGVKASPRVADGKNIPKGGGRYQVGKPYQVKGKWYTPKEEFGYSKVGMSSWYGSAFHGRLTANGEVYDKYHLSAAHPTFPLPSYARVTNMENGTSVIVRVNDRGPYEYGRVIDVSSKTADLLDMKRKGTAKVRVQYVGRAPLDGHDMPYLMASYVQKGDRGLSVMPEGQIATGVMVASNEPLKKQRLPAEDMSASSDNVLKIPPKSMLDRGVPLTALAEMPVPVSKGSQAALAAQVAPVPVAASASQGLQVSGGLDAFFTLPDIGPVPVERPEFVPSAGTAYAAAYVEARVSTSKDAFDAILVDAHPLTEQSVRDYGLRRLGAKGR